MDILVHKIEDTMIRKATDEDFEEIFDIINDAAIAYKGVIPADRWHEPYMTKEELRAQIEDGVRFSCYIDNNEIIGVMGTQDKADVELIRHAYVRTKQRKKRRRISPPPGTDKRCKEADFDRNLEGRQMGDPFL